MTDYLIYTAGNTLHTKSLAAAGAGDHHELNIPITVCTPLTPIFTSHVHCIFVKHCINFHIENCLSSEKVI